MGGRPASDAAARLLADLRGYGDSDKPASGSDHKEYLETDDDPRPGAGDAGTRLRPVRGGGHDRGVQVGHRLALDHSDSVTGLAVLDIVPTRYTFQHADAAFGLEYYHLLFLATGNGIPERLIGGDPEFWIRARMGARHHDDTGFDPQAQAEYVRCLSDRAAIHASCEDYRTAASIDLKHDEADAVPGNLVKRPVLAL